MHDTLARALALKAVNEGGQGGTSDYSELTNKPSINSVTLSGNKTLSDLGIQGTLSAGSNITINNGTISATDTTYTAGTNVSIDNGVISATDTTYSAGTNVSISNGEISVDLSSYANVVKATSSQIYNLQLTDAEYAAVKIGSIIIADGRVFVCTGENSEEFNFFNTRQEGNSDGTVGVNGCQLYKSTKKFGWGWGSDTSVFPDLPEYTSPKTYLCAKDWLSQDTVSSNYWYDSSSFATTTYVDTAIGGAIGGSY